MKIFITLGFLIFSFNVTGQDIAGKWFSADSTRIYEITKTQEGFKGTLFSSTRKKDTAGAIVLSGIFFNEKKNIYTGTIHSITDQTSTAVILKFKKKDSSVLYLRLWRLFFANFTLKWYRIVDENNIP